MSLEFFCVFLCTISSTSCLLDFLIRLLLQIQAIVFLALAQFCVNDQLICMCMHVAQMHVRTHRLCHHCCK